MDKIQIYAHCVCLTQARFLKMAIIKQFTFNIEPIYLNQNNLAVQKGSN